MLKQNALVAIVILAAATSACLSNEEKAARRACALDVAGEYTEVRSDGVAVGSLLIENEGDKNDVKLTFTRGALYDGEADVLDLLANEADREAIQASLALGVGEDRVREELSGGENISDNFGASSKIDVVGEDLAATPSLEGATDAKVRYSIAVEIENGSAELTGTLTATFSEQRPNATGDEKQLFTEPHAFPVKFTRAAAIEAEQSAECKDIIDGSN